MTQMLRPESRSHPVPSREPSASPAAAASSREAAPQRAQTGTADLSQPEAGGSLASPAGAAARPVQRQEPRGVQRKTDPASGTPTTGQQAGTPGSAAPDSAQTPTPDTFTDAQFEGVFPDAVSHFQGVRGARPIADLFTPEERRAVAGFIANRRLPPVGTFATFFSRVPDTLRFVFSACLHVADRSRVIRGANGQEEAVAVRANDCGDWVGRVVTYARNEAYVSRAQRRRQRMVSPDGLYRHGHGNQLLAANEQGIRSHRAVDRAIVDRLAPGDWVMIHWQAGTRPGESNHSMMFLGWVDARRDRQGRRRARFAHQGDNRRGGGRINEYPISSDPNVPPYVYNVRSDREFTAEARGDGAGAGPRRDAPGGGATGTHAAPGADGPQHAASAETRRRRVQREAPAAEAASAPAAVRAIAEAHPEKAR